MRATPEAALMPISRSATRHRCSATNSHPGQDPQANIATLHNLRATMDLLQGGRPSACARLADTAKQADQEVTDRFQTTHWSLVLAAARGGEGSAAALEWLCGAYWYPLYAFIRRQGHDPRNAPVLTQAF